MFLRACPTLALSGLLPILISNPLIAQPSPGVVRLATVPVPVSSGLLATLLPDFEQRTGLHVQVLVSTQDIYDIARSGAADLVISHYGFTGLESFVLEGLGGWPHPVFASSAVVVGPPSDPANIRGLTDSVEAFRRIAATQSLFIVNNDPNVKYLTTVLWEAAGRPDYGTWYSDTGLEGPEAANAAAIQGAYTIWGVDPFLQNQSKQPMPLDILVSGDTLLQRVMSATVVTSKAATNANVDGAVALRDYLISPAVQARISIFRYPLLSQQFWFPAGQNNAEASH